LYFTYVFINKNSGNAKNPKIINITPVLKELKNIHLIEL